MSLSTARRVLVTGGAGLLGRALAVSAPEDLSVAYTRHLEPLDGADVHYVDLCDESEVQELFSVVRPDVVVHTAYRTENGRRNILGITRNVALAASATGAGLIHLSSDLVFDGEHAPYSEDAPPSPVNEYGRWKAEAESVVTRTVANATVVRTSLMVSSEPLDPSCARLAERLRSGELVRLFVDELRSPVGVADLAHQLWEVARMAPGERGGVWHLCGPEVLSRYALGLLVASHEGLDASRIEPAPSSSHPEPRPRDVRLLSTRSACLSHRATPVSELLAPVRPPLA